MPLVDLKTDLRSLRFGSPNNPGDRPGGGWSNQPYITTQIDSNFLLPSPNRFTIGNGGDFIVRGGASAFVDASTDVIRLGKMFTDFKTPSGIQFFAKQNLLSMTGVNIFAGYPTAIRVLNRFRLNDGTYLPTSTLLAAGPLGNIIGAHPNKQGTDPTGNNFVLSRPQYTNLVTRGVGSESTNRLLNLNKRFIRNAVNYGPLFSYLGGPQAGKDVSSVRTQINLSEENRTGNANFQSIVNPSWFYGKGGATLTGKQLYNLGSNSSFRTTGTVQDFRRKVDSKKIGTLQFAQARKNGTLTSAPKYNDPKVRFEGRVNAGNPGNPELNRSNYTAGAIGGDGNPNVVNKINALYMYNAENVNRDVSNDFVKFRFAVINPDNPKKKTFVHFPAFFNGAITDNMGGKWGSFQYLGRGEEFFNYEGFDRSVGFSFKVVAQSKPELSIMYQKLNYLQSTLTPNFSENGFMRGNIHQLTIGGYFYEQPGVITALNYTIPDTSPWEIGISTGTNASSDPAIKELTHIIEVQVSFKPIHNFLPQTIGSAFDTENKKGIFGLDQIKQRFIGLTNGENNLYAKGAPYGTVIPDEPEEAIQPEVAPVNDELPTLDTSPLENLEYEEIPEDSSNSGGFGLPLAIGAAGLATAGIIALANNRSTQPEENDITDY